MRLSYVNAFMFIASIFVLSLAITANAQGIRLKAKSVYAPTIQDYKLCKNMITEQDKQALFYAILAKKCLVTENELDISTGIAEAPFGITSFRIRGSGAAWFTGTENLNID